MTLLILIAFAGLIAGFFLILDLSPFEFAESVVRPFQNRKTPIGKRIEAIKNPKPVKGIRKTVRDAKEVLSLMGKEGKFVTSRHLWERLQREAQANVGIKIERSENKDEFIVKITDVLGMLIIFTIEFYQPGNYYQAGLFFLCFD